MTPLNAPTSRSSFELRDGPGSARPDLPRWLTERGEPFEVEGDALVLRALPVRIDLRPDGPVVTHVGLTARTPLARLVGLVFDLSSHLHADVVVEGRAETRGAIWLRLSDEQDRLRIVAALARAEERGNREEVLLRMWPVIAEIRPGHDDRWDTASERIVELLEVGEDITLEDATVEHPGIAEGDAVRLPVHLPAHVVAWRWLADAYPGLAEQDVGSVWPR